MSTPSSRAGPAANRVEVKRSHKGLSLRVDGTFASWYRPGSELTGSVWDALATPLLWLPRAHRRSVLILGLGGGSAARVVRALAPRARIVGVECSAEVIRAARRWFDLDGLDVEVVHADARQYLRRCRARFDLILEDVFVGTGRSVHKPEWLPEPGITRAVRCLHRGGVLASNTIDETNEIAQSLRDQFPTALRVGIEGYDNVVVVGGPAGLEARSLRAAVASSPLLSRTLPRLSFRADRGGGARPR